MRSQRHVSCDPARLAAYDALKRFYRSPAPIPDITKELFADRGLSQLDISFASHLVYGVIRHQEQLDFLIRSHTSRHELPRGNVCTILRMGAFQLLPDSKVPSHAAIDESVELTRAAVGDEVTPFVNAVLRKVAGVAGSIKEVLPTGDSMSALSVLHSQPEWLISLLLRDYGLSNTRDLLSAFEKRLRLSVRANTMRVTKDGFFRMLREEGVQFERSELIDDCYLFLDDLDARQFSPLLRGDCYVQNESSAIVVELLSPMPSLRILDLCAAPGGKTAAMALATGEPGNVTAIDVDRDRVSLLKDNLDRLGLGKVQTDVADGTVIDGDYDLVLVDAPCSGLGTLAKHPEIKYTQSLGNIKKLAELQLRLLDRASRLVKPSGALVYSVCTITSRETTGVAASFLADHSNFVLEVPERFRYHRFVAHDGMLRVPPGGNNLEGMFAFRARRVSE